MTRGFCAGCRRWGEDCDCKKTDDSESSLNEGLSQCPHCGCKEYYVFCRMSGKAPYHYRYDGETADNTHLHDYLKYTEQKTMYCSDCQKKIGTKDPKNRQGILAGR